MKAEEFLNSKDNNMNDGRVRLSRPQVIALMDEYTAMIFSEKVDEEYQAQQSTLSESKVMEVVTKIVGEYSYMSLGSEWLINELKTAICNLSVVGVSEVNCGALSYVPLEDGEESDLMVISMTSYEKGKIIGRRVKWQSHHPQPIIEERIEIAVKLLLIRDALIKEDYEEAWHQLYLIASPNCDKYSDEVWKDLEAEAALKELTNKT